MRSAINMSQLLGLKNFVSEFSALAEDYVFTHIIGSLHPHQHNSSGPFRVDGLTWILCKKGSMTLDINLNHCELVENTLVVTGPETIVQFKEVDWQNLDCYVLFISTKFMQDINIDPNVLMSIPMRSSLATMPSMSITTEESDLLMRYFKLVHHNTSGNADDLYVRSISRCLVSAICYQVIQFVNHRQPAPEESAPTHSRRSTYVHEFMNLVHRYHRQERSVAFYASRLFISPKYLSLIIKESTGRSAAQWIDEFVILEAKNLLRFSGKNVQQVAYELNFPNQSSFGKYFKHLTGMSPSHYQKS